MQCSNPAANSLDERFRQQLKALLNARTQPGHWFGALPLIMLGLRTVCKADLTCSLAEPTYGTTLRLTGELFHSVTSKAVLSMQNYVLRLTKTVIILVSQQTRLTWMAIFWGVLIWRIVRTYSFDAEPKKAFEISV